MEIQKKSGLLVWIDLEMTGLDSSRDVILEIALAITDGNLNIIGQWPSYVIYQPEEHLFAMNAWCQTQHTKSGLVDAVRKSTVTLEQAEHAVLAYIKTYCEPKKALLAGNSVWQDRIFLAIYMPQIVNYLHYQIIDVSSVKNMITQWYSGNKNTIFIKSDTHRAYDDVQESIAELKHYRTHFFV